MSDLTGPSIMDPRDLRDEGYLAEVNRRFFHPLGLALAVEDLGENSVLMVLDDRDDLEGWHFTEATLREVTYKANCVLAEEDRRYPHRVKALGWWFQPLLEAES